MKGGAKREVTTPLEVVGWHVGLVSPTSTGHWDSICGGKCTEFRTEEETKIRKKMKKEKMMLWHSSHCCGGEYHFTR